MMKEQHRALRPALFLSLCVERKGNGRAVSHLIPSGPKDVVLPDEGIRVCGQWGTTFHCGRRPFPILRRPIHHPDGTIFELIMKI